MQLSEDILDVTKIETGSLILKKVEFDFSEMIIEILNEYRQRIKSANASNIILSYKCQEDNDVIMIEADRSRLCQVVNNLLSNAFRFTTKGSIGVTVEQIDNDKKIVIKIRDTGIGIHPFYRSFLLNSLLNQTQVALDWDCLSKSIIEKHRGKYMG